jgi:hypothetical protein
MKQRGLWAISAGLVLCAAQGAQGLQGRVVEATSGKPLAGVFVTVRWLGNTSPAVQPNTVCYAADVIVTGADGRYDVPEWSGSLNPFITDRQRGVSFYKKGYRVVTISNADDLVTMEPRKAQERERNFTEVSRQLGGYPCDLPVEKKLMILRPVHEELAQWAATPQERKTVQETQFGIDALLFGVDVAHTRMREQRLREEGIPERPAGSKAPAGPPEGSLGVRKQ